MLYTIIGLIEQRALKHQQRRKHVCALSTRHLNPNWRRLRRKRKKKSLLEITWTEYNNALGINFNCDVDHAN